MSTHAESGVAVLRVECVEIAQSVRIVVRVDDGDDLSRASRAGWCRQPGVEVVDAADCGWAQTGRQSRRDQGGLVGTLTEGLDLKRRSRCRQAGSGWRRSARRNCEPDDDRQCSGKSGRAVGKRALHPPSWTVPCMFRSPASHGPALRRFAQRIIAVQTTRSQPRWAEFQAAGTATVEEDR